MGDLELYTGEPIDDYGLDMHLSMGELTLNGSEQRPVMTSPGGPHSLKVTSDMGMCGWNSADSALCFKTRPRPCGGAAFLL